MSGRAAEIFIAILVPIVILLISPLWILSWVYRLIVFLIARTFRPDLHNLLYSVSNMMACDSLYENPKLNIQAAFFMDKPVDIREFQVLFDTRVMNSTRTSKSSLAEFTYPEMRQHIASFLGCYFWKWDKPFRIQDHVRNYDYTASGMELPEKADEADVRRIFSKLLINPWKKGQSPWEVLQIPSFLDCAGRERAALILVVHHSVGDGYSFLDMWLNDLLQSGEKLPVRHLNQLKFTDRFKLCLAAPFAQALYYAKLYVSTWAGPNPWSVAQKTCDRKAYYVGMSEPVPTALVKQIQARTGSSYTGVLLAATARATLKMMRYKGYEVPKKVACMVPVPIPNHPKRLVNHALLMPVTFTYGTKGDELSFLDYLYDITKQLESAQLPAVGVGHLLMNKILPIFPNYGMESTLRHFSTVSMGASYLPGGKGKVRILESVAEEIVVTLGLGIGTGGAFAVSCTLNGLHRFTMTMDKSVCSDPNDAQEYCDFIVQELMENANQARMDT